MLVSCSEILSNKDDTEDLAFSSTSIQKNTTKAHPLVKCKYCPKKYRHGLATPFEANSLTISTTYSQFNTILTEVQKQKNNNKSACLSTFANFISLKYPSKDATRIFAELSKFYNKQTLYNNKLIWNSAAYIDLSTWWSLSELQKLAIRILSIPTSSAFAECNYSNFGFIYSKLRNHLKNNQVKKLVYIYSNLRMYYTTIEQIIKSNENKNIDLVLNNEIENYKNIENVLTDLNLNNDMII
ncbi:14823_t:CDS:2 [Dentiscutata erythropus]|uniref:14823_t:CDS:1 n=1 Tax=Dentiscutata erythropus TaxID=1348616 RepID=A0A9N9ERM1_9GLOM|nr:14823_t:CDS:2 [Dentiscutata erythropus]